MMTPFDDLPDEPAEAAIELARRGFKVFPCDPETKGPLNGKGGLHKATNDPRMVEGIFVKMPSNRGALIGFPTGRVNGFVVVDLDVPGEQHEHDGFASLDDLAREGFVLPDSPIQVRTPGGGRHVYFQAPDRVVKSRAGVRPGIDIRGDGGYVIAPPSRRHDGKCWEVDHD